jgi:succinylglutamate desuccinylase
MPFIFRNPEALLSDTRYVPQSMQNLLFSYSLEA